MDVLLHFPLYLIIAVCYLFMALLLAAIIDFGLHALTGGAFPRAMESFFGHIGARTGQAVWGTLPKNPLEFPAAAATFALEFGAGLTLTVYGLGV